MHAYEMLMLAKKSNQNVLLVCLVRCSGMWLYGIEFGKGYITNYDWKRNLP